MSGFPRNIVIEEPNSLGQNHKRISEIALNMVHGVIIHDGVFGVKKGFGRFHLLKGGC